MIHRTRDASRFPEYSRASSASGTSRRGHRRKIPKGKIFNDEYTEPSQPQSPYESEEYEEDEQLVNSDGDPYFESDSISNAQSDHFSSPLPESITHKTNRFDATASLNSASNSPNAFQPITQIDSSYINIAPLPVFRGFPDECPVTHLSRFTKVCRANNVSSIEMMMKIFPVTLDNEAALWYDLNIEPYPSLTWEEIKSSFLEAFQSNDLVDQFRSELMMINQGQEETVRSYFLRLQWILKGWPDHGIPDTLLKGIFIDGLRDEFQDWIIQQKPNSLNDALRLAFTWEQVRSIRMARKKDVKCGFCDGAHEERGCEIRERMREFWLRSKEKPSVVCSARTESDEAVAKEIVRSVSGGEGSSVVGKHEAEDGKDEEAGVLGGKKKSQCQCWKHQCGKKNLERNNSIVTGNSNNAG